MRIGTFSLPIHQKKKPGEAPKCEKSPRTCSVARVDKKDGAERALESDGSVELAANAT